MASTPRLLWLFVVACVTACASETPVHETKQAQTQACLSCHYAAFLKVQTPDYVTLVGFQHGPDQVNCSECHATSAWTPTKAGHPEARFPIQAATSKHKNAAIGCGDCHIAALGAYSAGANTDCIHCHIGAHTIATIDATHAALGVSGYTPADPNAPHACLNCHPSGAK